MKPDKNKALMLAAGSKKGNYDPESPDQWKWVLRHGESATEVAMAWIKSKTTAFRHDSPFCVDEHGKALYIEHMAAECGWKVQTARNIVAELNSQGRARLETGKRGVNRIWYCADVPQAHQDRRTKDDGAKPVQSYLPTYVADFIEKLPEEKRATAIAKWEANLTWRREFLADGMAELRSIADRVEDATLQEIGLPKKRLPKRREAEVKWVQVKLFEEPNFVRSCLADRLADPAQNGPSSSYKTENDFVDARAVVTSTATESTPRAPASSISENSSSVDRSSSPPPKPPTDRPKANPENPYKTNLRKWLELKFKAAIPGYDLEDNELDHIAATIQTDTHLDQFHKAAERQRNPRGWIVFVKIAQQCEKQHAKYEQAMAAGSRSNVSEQEERAQRVRRNVDEERKWR